MKKMFVVLAVLVLSIGFIGCSSPTDPGNGGGEVTIDSKFHGTWHTDDGSMINHIGELTYHKAITVMIDATTFKFRDDAWEPNDWGEYTFVSSRQEGSNTIYVTAENTEAKLGGSLVIEIRENPNPVVHLAGYFTKVE